MQIFVGFKKNVQKYPNFCGGRPRGFQKCEGPAPPPQSVTPLYSDNAMRDWAHVSVGSLVPSAVEIESLTVRQTTLSTVLSPAAGIIPRHQKPVPDAPAQKHGP